MFLQNRSGKSTHQISECYREEPRRADSAAATLGCRAVYCLHWDKITLLCSLNNTPCQKILFNSLNHFAIFQHFCLVSTLPYNVMFKIPVSSNFKSHVIGEEKRTGVEFYFSFILQIFYVRCMFRLFSIFVAFVYALIFFQSLNNFLYRSLR